MLDGVGPRARHLVARRGPRVAAALLVVGLVLSAGAAWTSLHPPQTEVTDQVDRQHVESSLSTSAVVTGNTSLYPTGTRLADRPAYLLQAAPNATLTLRTEVPDGVRTRVHQRVVLHLRAARDGTAFWNDSRVLVDRTRTATGTVSTSATLDVAALAARLSAVRDEVGGAGTVRAFLEVQVSHRTDRYEATETDRAGLSVDGRWYAVGSPTLERTHARSVARTVTLPDRDASSYLLPGVAGVLALVAGAAVGVTYHRRYRGRDAAALALAVHRARYDDWISHGSVPRNVGDRAVQMDSLGDLVDVGIGAGVRTVHDRDRDLYVVFDGETTYFYDPFWDPGNGSTAPDRASNDPLEGSR